MNQIGIIHEHHKCRRPHAHLCHVINLRYSAGMGGRRIDHFRIFQKVIQYRSGYTKILLLCYVVNQIPKTMDSLFCLSRSEKHGRIGSKRKTVLDFLFKFVIVCSSFAIESHLLTKRISPLPASWM